MAVGKCLAIGAMVHSVVISRKIHCLTNGKQLLKKYISGSGDAVLSRMGTEEVRQGLLALLDVHLYVENRMNCGIHHYTFL